ncbi:hypothetical protein HNY73_000922 [Argiope bruennichi]|uniref:Uncharacterized protein n=1 Tax=Argiope bruennichi TaxID=94029 RepID=A0A8T0G0N4_ARGBR|nr:hypothetical protein HNY73_000922 [Argiope bruennichi]
MDESSIFSLSPGVFFLGLIVILFCILFTCIIIGKLCRQLDGNRHISATKSVQAQDERMHFENDKPPPYESLPPSYTEAICLNRDVWLQFKSFQKHSTNGFGNNIIEYESSCIQSQIKLFPILICLELHPLD